MANHTFIGRGKVYLKKRGAAEAAQFVGNCTKLEFSVTEDKKEIKDFTSAAGGTYDTFSRIDKVEANLSLSDLSPANLARALFGSTSIVTAAAVADEEAIGYKGGLIRTAHLLDNATAPVVKNTAGVTTYVVDTDYVVSAAGISIPETSSIPDSVAGAANLKISYTKKAATAIEVLTQAAGEYSLVFDGLNAAKNKPVVVDVHKFKMGPMANLGLISDDFAGIELKGDVLLDDVIIGAGLSKYFRVQMAS